MRNRGQKRYCSISSGTLSILFVVITFSRIASATDQSVPTVIFISPPNYQETSSILEQAIQSQMSDLNVTLRAVTQDNMSGNLKEEVDIARAIADEHRAIAAFWYHEVEDSQLFLYLIQKVGDRILVRAIKEETAGGRTEAAAIIVRLSVQELMRGGSIGIKIAEALQDKTPTPESDPNPVPQDENLQQVASAPQEEDLKQPASVLRLTNTLSYAYYAHSTNHPAVHGLDIELGVRIRRSWTLFVGYTVLSSIDDESSDVSIHYARHPVRLGAMWSTAFGPVEPGISLSAILDYTTYDAKITDTANQDDAHFLVSLFPALEIIFWVTNHVGLTIAAATEISINPEYYGYTDADGRHILLDSWRIQPWATLGMEFAIF